MAIVMIRHNSSTGAPPLPARNPPTQAPDRQIAQTTRDGRRHSEEKSVIHVKLERADRRPSVPGSRAQRSPRDQPEVATRNNENLCRRRDIETHSFIDRNTAKAYSDPASYKTNSTGNLRPVDHVVYPKDENTPPPPPIATLPRKQSKSSADKPVVNKKTANEQNTDSKPVLPTSLPPARPPKSLGSAPPRPPKGAQSPDEPSVPGKIPQTQPIQFPDRPPKGVTSPTSSGGHVFASNPARPPKLSKSASEGSEHDENPSMSDLERRFCFHSVSEFPDPEPVSIFNKRMPSMSNSFRKVDQQERIGFL